MDPGTHLGPYEIKEPLGKGGMGEVYRAHDDNLRRGVAIKLLPEELADDPQRLARLKREARSLASLNHPHIATVHGFEEHGGTRFIVMELVKGETLAEKLDGGPLPVDRALEFGIQTARALEAAHEQGIVHRDLKPSNVKITPEGDAKVLDFGLAKPFEAGAEESESRHPTATVEATETGTVIGTGPYMSPEQARGEEVDQRTDVWAFGCLIYEMLTGKRAFATETHSEALAAVLKDEPDWDALPSAMPQATRNLLRRCLRKDHDQRLHHIVDGRIELEDAKDSLSPRGPSRTPTSDEPAEQRSEPKRAGRGTGPLWPGLRRLPSGRSIGVGVAGMAMVAAALLGGWYLLEESATPEVTDRSIAVLPFETLGQEETTAFTDGIHGDMLTRLSKISDLRVVSRTSVMGYAGSDKSLSTIARELGVNWMLRAEVQEIGEQVQVNARLIDARQDRQVWGNSYQRKLTAENLFRIQGEITERVVTQLQAQLSPREERAVERAPTEDLAAYRLYVRGRALLEQRTPDEMRQAVDHFRQAIDQDPKYALAWAGLADGLMLMNWYGFPVPEMDMGPMETVQHALELNPELGEAHATLGMLHLYRVEGPPAVRHLERAVEIRPSYVQAQGWLCFASLLVGRPEKALEVSERVAELNPPPEMRVEIAEAHLAAGEPQRALTEARRGLRQQPEYGLARFLEGLALYHLGRYEEAKPVLRRASGVYISPGHLATLALAELATGNRARAQEILADMTDGGEGPFWQGLVHAASGETDDAFEAFRRVDRWNDWPTLPFRYFFPDVLGPLRQDPRYRELLREVNRDWCLNPDGSFPSAGEAQPSG